MHIEDTKSPKRTWDTLMKMNNTNTQAHKSIQKNKMNTIDYFTKVKNLVDVFAYMKTLINDEDLLVVILNGFGKNL